MADAAVHPPGLKERVIQELKIFWIVVLYLWVFLGSFTIYRRLIIAEFGASYMHYGVALIEALVIGKVIIVGRLFGFTHRFDNSPLVVPVLYKSIVFGLLVLGFGVVEHLVEGWLHGRGAFGGLRDIGEIGLYELGARVLMLIVAFIPFFAFYEIGKVLGWRRMSTLFFTKRSELHDARPEGT